MTATTLVARADTRSARPGIGAALRWEIRKVRAQWRARAVLLGALLGPVPVVVIVHGQSRPPKDSLFGRYATDNGFAMSLLVLGFAGQWVLPLLTAIVAGDIFAAEDGHGTWKTVLTRSVTRGRLFWAKTLVASGFAVLVLTVLGAATILAALLVVGHDPVTGLSGQTIPAGRATALVVAAWATALPPMLGFTALAIVLSVWSRSQAVGIAAPVVLGMVMQLAGSLGGVEALRPYLLSSPFEAWHGLLADPRFLGPLVEGLVTSAGWTLVALLLAHRLLRARDIDGG